MGWGSPWQSGSLTSCRWGSRAALCTHCPIGAHASAPPRRSSTAPTWDREGSTERLPNRGGKRGENGKKKKKKDQSRIWTQTSFSRTKQSGPCRAGAGTAAAGAGSPEAGGRPVPRSSAHLSASRPPAAGWDGRAPLRTNAFRQPRLSERPAAGRSAGGGDRASSRERRAARLREPPPGARPLAGAAQPARPLRDSFLKRLSQEPSP